MAREAAPAAKAVVSLLGRAARRAAGGVPGHPRGAGQRTPAEVGKGVTLLAEPAEEPLAGRVEELLPRGRRHARAGGLINASAACSGVGPAFWALVAEAWVDGGPADPGADRSAAGDRDDGGQRRAAARPRPRHAAAAPRGYLAGRHNARGLAALERGGVRAAFAAAMDDVLGGAA